MNIRYNSVTKSYRGQEILKNMSLFIPEGSIYFLLGLNGAGKTTMMKIALGMVEPDSGECEFSCNDEDNGIGAIIETPTFFENMSAYENLKYYALLIGCGDEDIKSALELLGLNWKNKKKVKKYSLGMKQRLALARAIMGNPSFIILDEPLNGLDPAGIIEVKDLLYRLNQERGVTIFLSSHLIRETDNLATHYAILHNSRIMSEFKKEEIEIVTKCIDVEFDEIEKKEKFMNKYETDLKMFLIDNITSKTIRLVNKGNDEISLKKLNDFYNRIKTEDIELDVRTSSLSMSELFMLYTQGGRENVKYC